LEGLPRYVLQGYGISEVILPRELTLVAATATVCVLLFGACGGTVEEDMPIDSSRIVSLSGDLTELVYELGAGDRLVGVDVTTVWPEGALELPIVGVGRFITAEGVLSVDPTLVIGDTQSSPPGALEQIRGAGVRVEILRVATSFEALYVKIESLGMLLDAEDAAEKLIARISSDIEEAGAQAVPSGIRVAYVYTRGPDVMLLFGDGMTTRPLIEAAGAIDAGADSGIVETVSVTAEALVAASPDVIIVPEEGLGVLGGVEAFLETPGVAQTPAGENGAILAYPEGDFLTFGPRVGESLRLLIADLQALGG
jgi:iron complex transport system substrate-binding protein